MVDRAEPVSSCRCPAQDVLPVNAVEESSQDFARGDSCSQETEGNGQTFSSVPEHSAGKIREDAGSQSADVTRDRCTNLPQNHTKDKPSKKPSKKFDLRK